MQDWTQHRERRRFEGRHGRTAETRRRRDLPGLRSVFDESPARLASTRRPPPSEPEGGRDGSWPEQGVYIISVAARIVEMHPQTLRKYDRKGLVMPTRTGGMLRLYSDEDIARLRLIKHLVGDLGLNMAGVQLAMGLFNELLTMRIGVTDLEGKALKEHLHQSLHEIFDLLHARLPEPDIGRGARG